jgi:hypothetical protein
VANLGNDVGNTASLTRDELMARLTQQYTEPSNDLDGGAVDDHGVSYDLEDADEDADYAVKESVSHDDDIEEADYEEIGEEVKYG